MATETIREFLVKLGYKQDEAALKKFSDGIGQATKAVVGLAAAVEASATVVAIGIERFASNLAALYYEAQRTNTSARELKALDIAAQNLGANAGEAESAVEGLARALRENPAKEGVLQARLASVGLTVKRMADGSIDATDATLKLVQALKAMGPQAFYVAKQWSEQLGIQGDTLNKLVRGNLMEEYIKALKELGPGFEEATKRSAEFMAQWRLIRLQLEGIGADVLTNVVKAFGFQDLKDFDQWLKDHHQEIVESITGAIKQIVTAARWLVSEIKKIVATLEEWDQKTGGLSTKLIALAAILKFTGAGSIIAGVIGLGGAFGRFAIAAAPALPILAALATGMTAIAAARHALKGEDASNWISNSVNWLLSKATGTQETLGGFLHDKLRPLGLRLNNPGNLRFAGQAGAALGDKGFAQFVSPEAGLFALARQLELYGSRGLRSIADILKVYAPATENNLPAYIRAVSTQTGFGATQALNLSDPQTLRKLMDAIILHEQGYNPFRSGEVGSAAQRAISIQSTIHVNGVSDPKKVADEVQQRQAHDLAAAVRNVIPGTQ